MTTSVQTFAFKTTGSDQPFNLRTAIIDGETWTAASDAARAAGLSRMNTTTHVSRLHATQVRRVCRTTLGLPKGAPMIMVSEGGLYALIMRSDKPQAREFQLFVTDTMLVSVRKTGGYLLNEAARETAHADTRTEMPLPAGFGELLKANLAMAELLSQAVSAPRP